MTTPSASRTTAPWPQGWPDFWDLGTGGTDWADAQRIRRSGHLVALARGAASSNGFRSGRGWSAFQASEGRAAWIDSVASGLLFLAFLALFALGCHVALVQASHPALLTAGAVSGAAFVILRFYSYTQDDRPGGRVPPVRLVIHRFLPVTRVVVLLGMLAAAFSLGIMGTVVVPPLLVTMFGLPASQAPVVRLLAMAVSAVFLNGASGGVVRLWRRHAILTPIYQARRLGRVSPAGRAAVVDALVRADPALAAWALERVAGTVGTDGFSLSIGAVTDLLTHPDPGVRSVGVRLTSGMTLEWRTSSLRSGRVLVNS